MEENMFSLYESKGTNESLIITFTPGADIKKYEIILYKDKHAFLEAKISEDAPHRPNQDYYIDKAKKNSYGAFIFPENKQQILNEMYEYLKH